MNVVVRVNTVLERWLFRWIDLAVSLVGCLVSRGPQRQKLHWNQGSNICPSLDESNVTWYIMSLFIHNFRPISSWIVVIFTTWIILINTQPKLINNEQLLKKKTAIYQLFKIQSFLFKHTFIGSRSCRIAS